MFGLGNSEMLLLMIPITISLLLMPLPLIFFLITLQNTFKEVKIENRRMQPGEVWLMLIPLFGLVWQFIIVNRLADSLKLEFTQRSIDINEFRPGYSIGLAYCVLFCCSIIPFLGFFTSIAGFICWIIYWVKISDFKNKLIQTK
jgi:hypothetical protein